MKRRVTSPSEVERRWVRDVVLGSPVCSDCFFRFWPKGLELDDMGVELDCLACNAETTGVLVVAAGATNERTLQSVDRLERAGRSMPIVPLGATRPSWTPDAP